MKDDAQRYILGAMEMAFRKLEASVPRPVKVLTGESFVFRYKEQSIEQAIVQKLARVISGLRAADVLHAYGFFQEQGAVYRTLDEINEDVMFLAMGITHGPPTPTHERYLKAFYQDQVPEGWTPGMPVKGPDTPPRREVRKVIKRLGFPQGNFMEQVGKTYSGYVHAASQNVMDMYGGTPPRFHLSGMRGTPLEADHAEDSWNYVFRGFLVFMTAAKAFGDMALVHQLQPVLADLDNLMGLADTVASATSPPSPSPDPAA